ncbi:MAG: hypothetical protein FJ267_01450 [Planctomycetes bacterium]|nr:hypothetical protein [Planctomycetota bacterium]
MTTFDWNLSILLADALIVIGGMKFVSSTSDRERLLSVSILILAIVLIFATNSVVMKMASLQVAALSILITFILWAIVILTSQSGRKNDL